MAAMNTSFAKCTSNSATTTNIIHAVTKHQFYLCCQKWQKHRICSIIQKVKLTINISQHVFCHQFSPVTFECTITKMHLCTCVFVYFNTWVHILFRNVISSCACETTTDHCHMLCIDVTHTYLLLLQNHSICFINLHLGRRTTRV